MKAKATKKAKKVTIGEGNFIRFVKKGDWEYAERNNCTGVVIIVAMTNQNRILFVEQYRTPVGKSVIEFPAGLMNDFQVKKRESLSVSAKRELLEETGYQAKKIVTLLKGPVSSGASSDIVVIVRALGLKKVGEGGGDHLESIIVHEVPFERVDQWLKKMERKGFLIEPKIYAGLYFLKNYNK